MGGWLGLGGPSIPPPDTLDDFEVVGNLSLRGVLANSYIPGGTLDAIRAQITIRPTATTSPEGGAQIALIPNDAPAFSQERTAMLQFYPEREYVSDVGLKAHRHLDVNGAVIDRHVQFHTKNAAGDNLVSRFEIKYKTDDAEVLITSAHLLLDTNAYISGTSAAPYPAERASVTGPIPMRGVPSITSQNATTKVQIEMGRLAADAFRIGVAGVAGDFGSAVTAADDAVIRLDNATKRLILQAGNDAAAIIISGVNAATPKIGFFNTSPITKPTGVAVTAAGIHAALVSLGLIAA